MAKCRICGEQHFYQSEYGPEEPCLCGHGVYESPWSYMGYRGVLAWFKYTIIRGVYEKITGKITDWLYEPWDY